MGGRQVRTDPVFGHVFDHFAIEYEYPGGVTVHSAARQIDGCQSRVEEVFVGTKGTCVTSSGRARIDGDRPWRFDGDNPNPYVEEHRALMAAITGGPYSNEGRRVAESTLTAIMGRMAAYTGKVVTWEEAMASPLDLRPRAYEFGSMPVDPVPMPMPMPGRV